MTFPAAAPAQHDTPADTLTSERVRNRLRSAGAPFSANDNISGFLCDGEVDAIQQEAEGHLAAMLRALVIDTDTDHNTLETAKRVAKMYVREVFAGRYAPAPRVTDFPNAAGLDQVYTVGPIEVRSACSHHLVPIMGQAWIGVLPGKRVIGLSKFARLAEWIMGRPQIQEEATVMLADTIEEMVEPKGLALVVRAKHLCCGWRGVKDADQMMTTSIMRGAFRKDSDARREFLALIAGQGH
jgi:GTP cyclohydrolase I